MAEVFWHEDAWRYGFEYREQDSPRSCRAQVTRISGLIKDGGLHRVLEIRTPVQTMTVKISPTGMIRAWKNDKELKTASEGKEREG
jgi:hypothetical protein